MVSVMDAELDRITVTELPVDEGSGGSPGFFDGVLEAYRRHGYEAGYSRATHDAFGAVALAAAAFVRLRGEDEPEARRLLAEFEAFLARRMLGERSEEYVEGGLGI